jgi:enoyl-CoA hydratase/carnithine racemase
MKFKTINFNIENGIALIELNRPKHYNALNHAWLMIYLKHR